jgi:hypothetical protein
MTTSTTCQVYWVSLSDVVTSHDSMSSSATARSSAARSTIRRAKPCWTSPAIPSSARGDPPTRRWSTTFCACSNHPVSVPDTMDCGSICFNFSDDRPSCNLLSLRYGYTSGDASNGVTEDACVAMRCVGGSTRCTTDGSTKCLCDNVEHGAQYLGGSSTYSYVCNCDGPAAIPGVYGSGLGELLSVCGMLMTVRVSCGPRFRQWSCRTGLEKLHLRWKHHDS